MDKECLKELEEILKYAEELDDALALDDRIPAVYSNAATALMSRIYHLVIDARLSHPLDYVNPL
jgi:hypothetical protein